MQKRVVITGIGVVSPAGIGKDAYWNSLISGQSAIGPISLFDASPFRARHAAEVRNLDIASLPGRKEQWSVSRSIALGGVAAKLALEDAGVTINDENRHQIGVVYGATLACLNVMARFDQQSIREGPRSCDPGMFPDTGVGAPACRVSIAFGVTAFNATLSNGATSGLDAIQYGVHFIRMGRAHTVLAGGMEELCLESFLGYYLGNLLALETDASRPFDRRRNGMVLGEGSAVLVLEDYEHARNRGAAILAEVKGYGTAFDPVPNGGPGIAMNAALRQAGVAADDIDLIAASANASRDGDLREATAIRQVFDNPPPVTALKSILGETYSASGAFEVAAGVLALNSGIIPPTINYDEPDPDCALHTVVAETRTAPLRNVLVNTSGVTGTNASLLLSAA